MRTSRIIATSSSGSLLRGCTTLCLLTFGAAVAPAGDFSLVLKGSFTTSAEIFPNAASTDPVARAQSYAIERFFGGGAEVRYRLSSLHLAVGLGVDYVHAISQRTIAATNQRIIPLDDGMEAAAVECTGYFLIPVAGPSVGITMGGGVGAYWGRRIYRVGDVSAAAVERSPGFGIHVLGGVSVQMTPWFEILGELKFRDLQFESTNQFSTGRITVRDAVITVGTAPFTARVHTYGIMFQLGAVVTL